MKTVPMGGWEWLATIHPKTIDLTEHGAIPKALKLAKEKGIDLGGTKASARQCIQNWKAKEGLTKPRLTGKTTMNSSIETTVSLIRKIDSLVNDIGQEKLQKIFDLFQSSPPELVKEILSTSKPVKKYVS